MSQHRKQRPTPQRAYEPRRRKVAPVGGHRAGAASHQAQHQGSGQRRGPRLRPRYGRMVAFAGAVVVSAIAVLAVVGVLPDRTPTTAQSRSDVRTSTSPGVTARAAMQITPPLEHLAATSAAAPVVGPDALPPASGKGRRVVFSISAQRVWLVDKAEQVASTYLVSGSVTDNLKPGSYEVYSRSRWANGIDDSGVMQYFVRFTRGVNAPIGFHSIPTKDGEALQTEAQLGTPQSHGCIRQRLADAKALWKFAPEGTSVVVTA